MLCRFVETGRGEFCDYLLLGQLHAHGRADRELLLEEVDVYDAAARFQRGGELGVVSGAILDVVQHVADEDRVHRGRRELRVVRRGEDRLDVGGRGGGDGGGFWDSR